MVSYFGLSDDVWYSAGEMDSAVVVDQNKAGEVNSSVC
jgi:hypothetical protein